MGTIIDISEFQRRKSPPEPIGGVGLCALFSRQGDWAFDYALALARHHRAKLNIFHFLESPYRLRRDIVFVDATRTTTVHVTPEFLAERDRELREMFDERAGDYVEIAFRLCEGNDEWELKKCFRRGQYDVLVVGYTAKKAEFGATTTIEEFARKFHGPVILVGPDAPDSFYLNDLAMKRSAELMIPAEAWKRIPEEV